MESVVRVAAIQAKPASGDFDDLWAGRDVSHALELLEEAVRKGARVACFPELYPRVGEEELCRAARRHRVFVIAGLMEGERHHWFNTATVIGPDGQVLGRQRKCFPTQGEIDQGVVAGDQYRVIETDVGKLGIVICADFPFFTKGIDSLVSQGADLIFNPSWWFALGQAYPATVIGRHMEYGKPIIGVDIAACSLARRVDGKLVEWFPRAGGFSTICIPPAVTHLEELAEWFRRKPGGINTHQGFVQTLGEDEGILLADINLEAVRRFMGYFFRATPAASPRVPPSRVL
jgi:predicted amidohydrolase